MYYLNKLMVCVCRYRSLRLPDVNDLDFWL
jgi:hypothetical protein